LNYESAKIRNYQIQKRNILSLFLPQSKPYITEVPQAQFLLFSGRLLLKEEVPLRRYAPCGMVPRVWGQKGKRWATAVPTIPPRTQ
jgi:hypothetical protein